MIAMAALFDMENLSRANDAGGIMALGILKLPAGDRLPADGPDKNEATELVATSLPDAPKRLPEALSDAEMAWAGLRLEKLCPGQRSPHRFSAGASRMINSTGDAFPVCPNVVYRGLSRVSRAAVGRQFGGPANLLRRMYSWVSVGDRG